MSQKKILYIAMSLDGYIATKSGSVDWLIDIPGYDFYDTFIHLVSNGHTSSHDHMFLLTAISSRILIL
jgi:dihydrofolate reductase